MPTNSLSPDQLRRSSVRNLWNLANPSVFLALTRRVLPWLALLTAALFVVGLALGFAAPPDYQQGTTVRIMFIHVPAAQSAMFVYACLGGASFFSLVFRHALADAAARAAACRSFCVRTLRLRTLTAAHRRHKAAASGRRE